MIILKMVFEFLNELNESMLREGISTEDQALFFRMLEGLYYSKEYRKAYPSWKELHNTYMELKTDTEDTQKKDKKDKLVPSTGTSMLILTLLVNLLGIAEKEGLL